MNNYGGMNGNYGVPRDVRAKVKLSMFYLLDLVIMAGTTLIAFFLATSIFPPGQVKQMIAFIILTIGIVFYLILPTNGGKKNWQSFLIILKRRKSRWISFDFWK